MHSIIDLMLSLKIVAKMFSSFYVLVAVFLLNCGPVAMDEMLYDRVELLNATYQEGLYNISEFRVTKFNRTSFVIKANFEFLVDFDDKIEVEVSFHYNRLNNNQYTKSLARVPRDKLCTVAKKFQATVFTAANKEKTNFPTDGEAYCPLKKVSI